MQTIFVIGDSTVENGKDPFYGWGGQLQELIPGAKVINTAMGGRSSKSFWDEGRFSDTPALMNPGDLLLIAFGHNDEKDTPDLHTDPETTFPEMLMRYITAARNRDAIPVLVTSVSRNYFVGMNVFLMYTHGAYPQVMRELARCEYVPLIDMEMETRALLLSLGQDKAGELFVHIEPGVNSEFPNGHIDQTHFNLHGAKTVAALIAADLHKLNLIKE